MPNSLAYAMLLLWPLVSLILFQRLRPSQAAIWTILGGYLILPPDTRFDLPLLPDLDKFSISNICAFIGFVLTRKEPWGLPHSGAVRLALVLFLLAPVGMVLTNLDIIPLAVGTLSPMILQEIPASIMSKIVTALPLLIGYHLLRDEETMRDLLVALVFGGLFYSVPMLIEVAIGPELNVMVYGFLQHSFEQTVRYGGFRPIVFLPHGLWVAFFAFMATMSAVALLRTDADTIPRNLAIVLYLAVVLVLCKSANAIVYILLMSPLLFLASPKTAIRVAAAISAIVLLYPLLRGVGIIPATEMARFAASIDPERASSLIFRLNNEDALLAHAAARPVFGWGGWGRNLLFDPVTGGLLTITDGRWIIAIGVEGWFGYLGEFGLLTMPVFVLALRVSRSTENISRYATAIALMLAANLADLILNATLVPLTWLLAGSILGYANAFQTRTGQAGIAIKTQGSAPWAKSVGVPAVPMAEKQSAGTRHMKFK